MDSAHVSVLALTTNAPSFDLSCGVLCGVPCTTHHTWIVVEGNCSVKKKKKRETCKGITHWIAECLIICVEVQKKNLCRDQLYRKESTVLDKWEPHEINIKEHFIKQVFVMVVQSVWPSFQFYVSAEHIWASLERGCCHKATVGRVEDYTRIIKEIIDTISTCFCLAGFKSFSFFVVCHHLGRLWCH